MVSGLWTAKPMMGSFPSRAAPGNCGMTARAATARVDPGASIAWGDMSPTLEIRTSKPRREGPDGCHRRGVGGFAAAADLSEVGVARALQQVELVFGARDFVAGRLGRRIRGR